MLPLVSLMILPFGLYTTYFGDFLPRLSGITCLSGLNQSLPGIIGRLMSEEGTFTSWSFVPITIWVRLLTTAIAIAAMSWAVYRAYRCRRNTSGFVSQTGAILLAVTPLISPLGWEYSFVLIMPLIVWLLMSSGQLSKFKILPWLFLIAIILLSIPKPNDSMVSRMEALLPGFIMHAFFARWTLGTILLIVIDMSLIHNKIIKDF